MKLIKKLGTKPNKTGKNVTSWGLFFCPYCKKEIEKDLGAGKTQQSCGCNWKLRSEAHKLHGGSKTLLYQVWASMKKRCYNPKSVQYKNYRVRGITVCEKWKSSYVPFKNWALKNGYKEGLILDRKNNDGSYEPNNCRFVTPKESLHNTRVNVIDEEQVEQIRFMYEEGNHTQRELAKIFSLDYRHINMIVNHQIW